MRSYWGHNIKLISNFLPKLEEKNALIICTNININFPWLALLEQGILTD